MSSKPERPKSRRLRCAIYTRKSSEEGLDQSFNSLHAQREACEAYVKSQAHEGWIALAAAYDDGGYSGGSMDRPGLRRLLADIDAGLVDVVVVYKVDRLTRALSDFAKIVDAFDARHVSFVSITQAFNTTTSMGRLTLNVLLSFAQFEREVTGERIRDKIAASKAKGMWMGGNLPLGYDSEDRALLVNEVEAEQVRTIFRRYLELGSVDALREDLRRRGWTSKSPSASHEASAPAEPMGRGALYHLLQNRLYRGQIVHKGKVYPGRHPEIVDAHLFEAVQRRIEQQRIERRQRPGRAAEARLIGRLRWADGCLMTPSFGYGRGGRRYRYYVAEANGRAAGDHADAPRRIPAEPLEAFAVALLRRLASRPDAGWSDLGPALERIEVRARETYVIVDLGALLADEHPDLAFEMVEGRLHPNERLLLEPHSPGRVRIVVPLRLKFRGGRSWLTGHDGQAVSARAPNPILMAGLRSAHEILERHGMSLDGSVALDARAPPNPYSRRLCQLALLSPDIQRMIREGRQPSSLSLFDLLDEPPPILWKDQLAWLDRRSGGLIAA